MQTTDQIVRMNVSIPYFTGIPEDVIVNTWHAVHLAGDPVAADFLQFANRLKTFYDAVYAAIPRGSWVNIGATTMTAYKLWEAEPRQPAWTATIALAGTGLAGNDPPEVALCLSYKGDYISGVAPARQRGRVFLGGFGLLNAAGSASSFPNVSATNRNIVAGAATALLANLLTDSWSWVVFSPTQTAEALQESFDVTGGWVDNAADTQRRRGNAATARSTWP